MLTIPKSRLNQLTLQVKQQTTSDNHLAPRTLNNIKMTNRPDLHLYTTQTPNGIKISITLEELVGFNPRINIDFIIMISIHQGTPLQSNQDRHLQKHSEGTLVP